MTDTMKECAHHLCSCDAIEGEYCSDYCRESSGKDEITCACGHQDCMGSGEDEIATS